MAKVELRGFVIFGCDRRKSSYPHRRSPAHDSGRSHPNCPPLPKSDRQCHQVSQRGMPQIQIQAVQAADCWRFSIQDNGIGIEPQYCDRIFTIFQRLHTSDEYSGKELGLAICEKIVQNHGGRIWVESQLGQGSTFYFEIPN
jgi:Histidine kinase-, DNA gyrase B-, and HSP90-like ATPase